MGRDTLTNTRQNWQGYNNNINRPVIRLECPEKVPCTDITLENVNLWTVNQTIAKEHCWNAYGTGACLESESDSTSVYSSNVTPTMTP